MLRDLVGMGKKVWDASTQLRGNFRWNLQSPANIREGSHFLIKEYDKQPFHQMWLSLFLNLDHLKARGWNLLGRCYLCKNKIIVNDLLIHYVSCLRLMVFCLSLSSRHLRCVLAHWKNCFLVGMEFCKRNRQNVWTIPLCLTWCI